MPKANIKKIVRVALAPDTPKKEKVGGKPPNPQKEGKIWGVAPNPTSFLKKARPKTFSKLRGSAPLKSPVEERLGVSPLKPRQTFCKKFDQKLLVRERQHKPSLRSFTLIETMVALGLLTVLILQVATVQGQALYFSDYGQNLTKGTWLARRMMAQVEYYWYNKELKELEGVSVKEKPFEDEPNFSYNLEIREWKLPLMNMLGGGGENDQPDPTTDMIKEQIKQIFGEHLLKIAHVEVFWGEGAVKESTSLALLLTNQKKIDTTVATLEATQQAKKATKKKPPRRGKGKSKGKGKGKGTPPPQKGGNDA